MDGGPVSTPRRTKDGGYIVPAGELRVGDRLRFAGLGEVRWGAIYEFTETPGAKTRRIHLYGDVLVRIRRTTLVARAPRKDEGEGWS
jgi:hypothetical protein